jgi:hypothetical protein
MTNFNEINLTEVATDEIKAFKVRLNDELKNRTVLTKMESKEEKEAAKLARFEAGKALVTVDNEIKVHYKGKIVTGIVKEAREKTFTFTVVGAYEFADGKKFADGDKAWRKYNEVLLPTDEIVDEIATNDEEI